MQCMNWTPNGNFYKTSDFSAQTPGFYFYYPVAQSTTSGYVSDVACNQFNAINMCMQRPEMMMPPSQYYHPVALYPPAESVQTIQGSSSTTSAFFMSSQPNLIPSTNMEATAQEPDLISSSKLDNSIEVDEEGNELGKLFIGGISQGTTSEMLLNYFVKFGEVLDASVMMDNRTGRSRGFGYVRYKDHWIAEEVVAQREHFLQQKKIDVKLCNVHLKGRNRRNLKLFVGGIAPSQTPETLRTFFSQFGQVTDVKLIMSHNNPTKHRGFGFVGFLSQQVVRDLVKQRVFKMYGKTIEVKELEPPNHYEDNMNVQDKSPKLKKKSPNQKKPKELNDLPIYPLYDAVKKTGEKRQVEGDSFSKEANLMEGKYLEQSHPLHNSSFKLKEGSVAATPEVNRSRSRPIGASGDESLLSNQLGTTTISTPTARAWKPLNH